MSKSLTCCLTILCLAYSANTQSLCKNDYSDFAGKCDVLVDDPTSAVRKNQAALAVDKNGRPALYLLFDERTACAPLSRHKLEDLLKHWKPAEFKNRSHTFFFKQYINGVWKPVRVDLHFGEDRDCDKFRVVSNETKIQDWQPTDSIPVDLNRHPSQENLKLPLVIGLVEGPRDMPDCGIRPISDFARKSIEQEQCPYRAK